MGHQIYPRLAYINDITNAQNAVATFTEDCDFTDGEYVSFRVTKDFGMYQINQKRGKVLSHTSDTITVDIDSSNWTPFSYALIDTEGTTPPCCVPAGSGIIPSFYPETVNLEDSFDNRRT
jgi:hypothetical protein